MREHSKNVTVRIEQKQAPPEVNKAGTPMAARPQAQERWESVPTVSSAPPICGSLVCWQGTVLHLFI